MAAFAVLPPAAEAISTINRLVSADRGLALTTSLEDAYRSLCQDSVPLQPEIMVETAGLVLLYRVGQALTGLR